MYFSELSDEGIVAFTPDSSAQYFISAFIIDAHSRKRSFVYLSPHVARPGSSVGPNRIQIRLGGHPKSHERRLGSPFHCFTSCRRILEVRFFVGLGPMEQLQPWCILLCGSHCTCVRAECFTSGSSNARCAF